MTIQQNSKDNIDWNGISWISKQFSHPERTIRLATSFSGIGAIEYAMRRLGLKTEIVFAGDIDKIVRQHILPTIILKKTTGIRTSIFLMQNHTKERWIYLLVEPHVKHSL